MIEREPGPKLEVINFPFSLPERFLDQIGYSGLYQIVGLYWESAGDELAVYDPLGQSAGAHNHWPYLDLMRQPQVWHWLSEFLIDLGSSDSFQEPSHHLVVSGPTNEGYIARASIARRIVREQRLDWR